MHEQKSLTIKQELFCKAYIELGNASQAYRQAYDAENMQAATINRKAFELTENGNIRARLDELRKAHAARHVVTVDSLVTELEDARQLAKGNGTAAAMVSATMGKAKLLGFDKLVVESTVRTVKTLSEFFDELHSMS